MSYLLQASNAFFDVCAFVASGIRTATDGANYVIQLNYNVVAGVCTHVHNAVYSSVDVASRVCNTVQNVYGYLSDFVHEFCSLVSSGVFCVWRFCVGVYGVLDSSYLTVVNFITSIVGHISQAYFTMKQTAVSSYEGLSYVSHLVASSITTAVTSVFLFVTSIGSFSVNFVTGVWQGLGYVLSSIAYFPVYCVDSLVSLKERFTNYVIHAFTEMPKETYLGIVCLCLLYFVLSNTLRYLSCRGMPLFSSRIPTRRRTRRGLDWHFDRGFESDFEDLYSSDADEQVWNNDHNATADSDGSDNDDVNDENNDDDSNDSGTVDDGISDIDDDDDDEGGDSEGDDDSEDNTVVTEESDSDASLNSMTFSTGSSDHEIEVQLPSANERYSLRSRSSTPARQAKACSSPEEFDREMERERDKRKCVVCQDQIKSVLVLPCRHMCMCVDCADHIVRSRFVGRRVCPLCRTRIEKVMNVYV